MNCNGHTVSTCSKKTLNSSTKESTVDMKSGLVIFGLIIVAVIAACEKQLIPGNPEGESLQLQALYREIDSIAGLYVCDDVEEWQFTAIGDKPCGGPTGYIAFSSRLDTASFLNKVETYTNLQREYNLKWDVVSDCMYVTSPSRIICEDGKPKLVWDSQVNEE